MASKRLFYWRLILSPSSQKLEIAQWGLSIWGVEWPKKYSEGLAHTSKGVDDLDLEAAGSIIHQNVSQCLSDNVLPLLNLLTALSCVANL